MQTPVSYSVRLYNDMGHLMTDPGYDTLPRDVFDYVISKTYRHLRTATDTSGHGCRFYILKPDYDKYYNGVVNGKIVEIHYDVNTFDSQIMRFT